MKKILLLIAFTSTLLNVLAQQSDFTSMGRGVSTTFVTDYHVTGINPANLGFKRTYETKHVTFGLAEVGFTAYSGALEKDDFRNSITNFKNLNFTDEEKRNAAQQFADENLALNIDANWLGFSYQNDKIGGFAFNVRETGRWFSTFNKNLSDIMFLGYKAPYFDSLTLSNGNKVVNDPSKYETYESIGIEEGFTSAPKLYSQLFEGSKISMMLTREYALSYGKEVKINDYLAIAGGIGIKYIQGFSIVDIEVKDGVLTSYGSFSPAFGIDFGSATSKNPSSDTTGGYKPVGHGAGFDIGFNVYYKEKIKIGFAFTNMGSITWDGNVYTAQDTSLYNIETSGFENYNVFSQAEEIASDQGLFKWQGKRKLKTNLPSTFRFGISHQFEDKGEIGFDMIIPMNDQPGSIKKPYWAIGGDIKPFKFLKLSTGIAYGGNFDTRVTIPLGITLVVGEQGSWEVGFASRDAVTYFRQKGPAISFAMGFLRFRV